MKNPRAIVFAMGSVLLTTSLFVLDVFFLPLRVAIWLPYIGVVLLALWLPHRRHTYVVTGYCSVLTLAGLFLSPPGGEWGGALVNRLLAVIIFWITAMVGLAARRARELERANVALQEEIRRREELESQLLRSQRLESIGVLAGGIAHDMNNLLTPILMAIKLLRERRSEEERSRLLDTLQAGAERGADMVRQLISFAGGVSGERSIVQARDVIAEVQGIIEHTFPKTISLRIHLAQDLPSVSADATQLTQVLLNLCVNARDAMPSGGTLSIAADRARLDEHQRRLRPEAAPGAYLRITVKDTGCGMSPEVLDKAFDPFFTTKPQGKGTGLGLSTALGIVRAHGGIVQLESEAGYGSRFEVYLPAREAQPDSQGKPVSTALCRGHGELILAVDDESLTLETVAVALERHGYRVITASGGAEALTACQQHGTEIRAVLLDLMMPGMDAETIIARLLEVNPGIRIIASSGLPPNGCVAKEIAAGQIAFLPKPYAEDRLLASLEKALHTC